MDDSDWLATQFENNRQHLRAVAYRMLGSVAEADDAVQETWIRFSNAEADDVENLGGWLTTIVARISLNMLKSRATRREAPLDEADGHSHDRLRGKPEHTDPEQEALMADSVGAALLVILDMLTPAERLAFVLHDMFALSFEEIAPIVDRSPAATRQLASRARRRVQQSDAPRPEAQANPTLSTGQNRQREVVRAFLTASRKGDFAALLTLLDPGIVLRADGDAIAMGTQPELTGPQLVAQRFSGGAQALRLVYIDGLAGLVWAQAGQIRVMFKFSISDDTITGIELIANPVAISTADIDFVTARGTTFRYDK
jgi:RNA polymerase sigma-70 factor (ECF subfamily)